MAALIGTTSDRKTTSSSSSDSPTTMMPNGTSAELSFSATSTPTAVLPVTAMLAPVCFWMAPAWPRMSVTRCWVAIADGAVVGTTWMRAYLLSALIPADGGLDDAGLPA